MFANRIFSQHLILSGLALIAQLFVGSHAQSAEGQFYTYSAPFLSYYAGAGSGPPSPCYSSGSTRVYESHRFLTYSAGSADNAVIQFAQLAETALTSLEQKFGITDGDIGVSSIAATKLKLCADATTSASSGSFGAASGVGASVTAVDHPGLQAIITPNNYRNLQRLLGHELTHYIQAILVGSTNPYGGTNVEHWFAEGLATYASGQEYDDANNTLAIQQWFNSGNINPISVKTYIDQGSYASGDIYPYYTAAVAFIFDTPSAGGAGNSLKQVPSIFRQMKQGASFTTAMANMLTYKGIGITPSAVQANYQPYLTSYFGAIESKGTVQGATGLQKLGVIGANDIWPPQQPVYSVMGVVTGNQFTINVQNLPDGAYQIAFINTSTSPTTFYGPWPIHVAGGKLAGNACDVVSKSCTGETITSKNYSDSWWNATESGWGITITDHDTNAFVQWYTYDQTGHNQKYVISGGTFSSDKCQFNGAIQHVTGPSWILPTFDPNQVTRTTVGSGTFDFCPVGLPTGTAVFSYTADGVTSSKQLTRLPFGNDVPHLGGMANTGASDFTDLWWNPAESGWGVSVTQHGDNIFFRVFTYDTDNKPLLFVVAGVTFNGSANSFTGQVTLTSGPWFGTVPFDPNQVVRTPAGTATLTFTDANNGVLSYTVNGVTVTKTITRLVF